MVIIPAIDLRGGKCVRLTQGSRHSTKVYDEDPREVALRFESEGAVMLHIVDLDGAFSDANSDNRTMLREIIRSVKVPIQFGGGLRDLKQVKEIIDAGVARVVVGTVVIEAPDLFGKMISLFGSRRIAVAIDARDDQVVMHGWEAEAALNAVTLAVRVASMGAERIIYTDVRRDGTLNGPNIRQTCEIAKRSGLKVTASGGVSSLADLERIKEAGEFGIDSVIVGKALYEGRFTLAQAQQAIDIG